MIVFKYAKVYEEKKKSDVPQYIHQTIQPCLRGKISPKENELNKLHRILLILMTQRDYS